jgi:hypothetical protein
MTSVWEEHPLRADQLDQLGCMCAWDGCGATFEGDMPHGWRWLLGYWAPQPQLVPYAIPHEHISRDAVLCPKHAAAFERLLKELPRQLDWPPAGSA